MTIKGDMKRENEYRKLFYMTYISTKPFGPVIICSNDLVYVY